MESLKAALALFVTRATESVGICTALTALFLYHVILDKNFECTCEDQTSLCWSYMILPMFIIFFIVLWLDRAFQAILKYTGVKRTRFCLFLWRRIIRAIFISLLWPISVLIDGDWYTCCWHKEKPNCRYLTADYRMITKNLNNTSQIGGFGVLLGIVFVAAILRPLLWDVFTRCLIKCSSICCNECCPHESDYRNKYVLFEKIVLEEGENLMTDKLIKVAKEKIDEKINEYAAAGQWGKCFGVVNEIVGLPQHHNNSNPPPGGSSSVVGRGDGSGEELQRMVQPPSQESPSGSSPRGRNYEDAEERGGSSGVGKERIPLNQFHESPSGSSSNIPTT